MLPSRGLSRSGTASALRNAWSTRTQSARSIQVPTRHFSQSQLRSTIPTRLRGAYSTPISSIGTRATLGATACGVFAQRSGASRNLSLWPFSSKPQSTPETQPSIEQPASTTYDQKAPEATVVENNAASAPPEASSSIPTNPVDLNPAHHSTGSFSDLDITSILDIPEQIGYLKSLGLDFGWGPTSCCEWIVEHIYIYTGLPWWATIAAVAVAWRVALFKPTLTASKHQALLQAITKSPEYIQANAEYQEAAFRTGDRVAQVRAQEKMMRVRKQSGASVMRSFVVLWTVPLSYGMFRLFRGMSALPVPSLETGGLAWFTDLTVHDPYYILPMTSILLTVLMFSQTRAAALSSNPTAESVQKGMKYIMPPVMFLCTAWLPASVQLFFVLISAGSVLQTTATLNPAIRRWADLPPLPTRPATTASTTGLKWQLPTSRPSTDDGEKSSASESIKGMFGVDKQKEEWKKAQAYEERRAREEREKEFQRMEEIRRRRAGKKGL
ncbi:60Kd inner membrane protein-domain-containing protein [Hypoxylon trugodes]|uniref:60Kd inner membrane protein-domain-containing protein n=1 Tax=Hypoxylon trugodes TaxID=326681 RepID=UPI00219AB6DB|nr:60Kd inner membrane protein-domain-containing protein [Hypoxylon trugodes]KAI1391729.1 60Kd inner membrane protein-domain-containing protein [Hypoxylon trugodes]